MITQQIVSDTIEMIEDLMDYVNLKENVAQDDELKERLGEMQRILNFWRMYKQFAPREEK